MKNKKLLGILGITALLLAGNFAWQNAKEVDAANMTGGELVYLDPTDNWAEAGAKFAIYVYGSNGVDWASMADSDNDGIYECAIPVGNWTNLIFVRINPSATELGWNDENNPDRVWAQTGDLTYDSTKPLFTMNGQEWATTGVWEKLAKDQVKDLFVSYLNDGNYVKSTSINVNNATTNEIKAYFHAGVSTLIRKTYYQNDALWMENGSGYSYYGTDGSNMTSGKVDEIGKTSPSIAAKGKTMDQYYVTLNDFANGINESVYVEKGKEDLTKGWSVSNKIYTSQDANVIDAFRLFTAPLWLNTNGTTSNYIQYDKVTVQEENGMLVMKLYAKSTNSGLLTQGSNNVFSVAYIEKGTSHTHHVGSFIAEGTGCRQHCLFCDDTTIQSHTGGTATFTAQATCTNCGNKYGEIKKPITIVFELNWDGITDVYFNEQKMTSAGTGKWTTTFAENSISSMDLDFCQHGTWWHVDSDNNKNTVNKNTNSKYTYTFNYGNTYTINNVAWVYESGDKWYTFKITSAKS